MKKTNLLCCSCSWDADGDGARSVRSVRFPFSFLCNWWMWKHSGGELKQLPSYSKLNYRNQKSLITEGKILSVHISCWLCKIHYIDNKTRQDETTTNSSRQAGANKIRNSWTYQFIDPKYPEIIESFNLETIINNKILLSNNISKRVRPSITPSE